MDLRGWQQLYARAERAARAFFAEHFGDVCERCFAASEARAEPAFCCCRRTNFLPDILADPLLGGLAEESLGRSLLVLAGRRDAASCGALGPTGCRIPFGRPEACNAYTCEHIHRCQAAVLTSETLCRLVGALEVFATIADVAERRSVGFAACVVQVAKLEAVLGEAGALLRERAADLSRRKAEVVFEMLPPGHTGPGRA